MWLSLICTNWNPSCDSVWPSSFEDGTPPAMVHTTPDPAQAMQRRNPLRSMLSVSVFINASVCQDDRASDFIPPGINSIAAESAYLAKAPGEACATWTDYAGKEFAMEKQALFEQIIMPHLNAAYNLARWLTRNADDAEDLVQEAYLRAYRSFETLQGQDGRAWLLAVVRNTCFTWLNKKGNRTAVEFDEQIHGAAEENAETVLLNEAALGSLHGCLEGLPLEFREVMILRELEELPYKEISEIVRVPIGTVMSRLARGRKRLQQCLEGALK
jgi:RNA polymerase sigma-70 factor (ECF subfamily)